MPVEAEWDPIAGKVVYRNHSPPGSTSGAPPTPATENEPPNVSSTGDDGIADVSHARRRSRSQTRKPKALDWRREEAQPPLVARSAGIAPHSFHGTETKEGHAFVNTLHATAQQRHWEQQTAERRQEHAARRHAFGQLTEYRTFPWQRRAVRRCRQLQIEWGLSSDLLYYEEESGMSAEEEGTDAPSSSASSASSSSSLEAPDRKRWVGAEASSSQQKRVLHYHRAFLNERNVAVKSVPAHAVQQQSSGLGPALYCLEPRVFSVETKKSTVSSQQPGTASSNGRRRYVTAQVGRFLEHYWCRTAPAWRHAYEVIPPRTPCRLYLDLECTMEPDELVGLAPETRALQEQVLDELFLELADELRTQFGSPVLDCPHTKCAYRLQPLQRRDVVDLDSSTATKFSRHWIVHIPVKQRVSIQEASASSDQSSSRAAEALFADAAAVGVFVRQWIGRLAEQQATRQLQEKHRTALQKYLFVSKKPKDGASSSSSSVNQPCCLVDLGVYTRNRLFRLMGSTKYGKPVTAALRIAEANQFRFADGFGNHSFYVPEMPLPPMTAEATDAISVDDIESRIQASLSKTDWMPHAESLAATFVVPINVAKIDYPILPPATQVETRSLLPPKFSRVVGPSALIASFGKSPYPMVDEFVQTHLASRGGTQGLIRAWTILRSADTHAPSVLSFQMIRNRFCECIGREHKSNNISWNCDLVLFHCYQTCYDPDCRALNFRGTPIPLPTNVQEALQEALFEEALARLDITGTIPPPPPPQNLKGFRARALESSTLQDQTKGEDDNPVDVVDANSSFDSALAALNLADSIAKSNRVSLAIKDEQGKMGRASALQSMKESSISTEPTASPVQLAVQKTLSSETNHYDFSDSDDESDIDLVALCRDRAEAFNCVDTSSKSNIVPVAIAEDTSDLTGTHASPKDSFSAEETVSPVKSSAQKKSAGKTKHFDFSDSDDESDIDLVALCRERAEALNRADNSSKSNGDSIAKTDERSSSAITPTHASTKESILAEESVSHAKFSIDDTLLASKTNHYYSSDSDDESDIDLVALCREREAAERLGSIP